MKRERERESCENGRGEHCLLLVDAAPSEGEDSSSLFILCVFACVSPWWVFGWTDRQTKNNLTFVRFNYHY
jgi:hypothetical protein